MNPHISETKEDMWEARDCIDRMLGENYSEEHPQLLGMFLIASALRRR